MNLTKLQKNFLFETITSFGLNPAEFEFLYISGITRFIHNPTQYFVEFQDSSSTHHNFYLKISPGIDKHTEYEYARDWEAAKKRLLSWGAKLLLEISTPDLWVSYIKIDTKLGIDAKENIPFTVKEQKTVVDKLNLLENRIISEFHLDNKQSAEIKTSIENLIKKSESFGRKDWFLIFMGTLQNIIFVLALDPEKKDILVKIVEEVFSKFFMLTGG